jgi:superfamily II DNA or RNA helicase
MSYFSENYTRINYTIATSDNPRGLRNAQVGAIHSIASHFTLFAEPALVTMPTGSGKTAILNLTAYTLRAKRVLVITSSVLVRGQIFEEFTTLKTLKYINVFHTDLGLPNCSELKSPIKSLQEWEYMSQFDMIIGIPNSINVGINDDFSPPPDLFDLILVDEAHHVPAFTWTKIIQQFPNAKKVFFTATPFRRDRKEIQGRIVYSYSLKMAYQDGIFGDLGYYPVISNLGNTDLAIALEAHRIFEKDRSDGLRHYLMVRTETKEQASELEALYSENTTLKLKKVDSSQTYTYIKRVITKLREGALDGIICVDMFGEGFDFPNLKIAAIHSPKKSLSNTLQFIGRFSRTNADNIGQAKFIAIPNDIEIGKIKLYAEGSIWNDIIRNLNDEAIEEEDEIKSVLDSYENELAEESIDDISFYNLNPYCHVKIYSADGINLQPDFNVPGQNILYHRISEEYNSVIIITNEFEKPKWISTDDLINVMHYLYFIFYDTETKLLFINSSIKTISFYDELVRVFAQGTPKRISKYSINKVLADISNTEFFNIGMQNRSANSGESYRIIAGSNAENTIKKSDGKNYANGHVFLKGVSDGENITMGYSSASKVWSNAYEKIPKLIKWCKHIGNKIISEREVKTNTGFDNLPIGIVIDRFPYLPYGATWNQDTFVDYPFLLQLKDDEIIANIQLLDFDINVKKESCSATEMILDIGFGNITIPIKYDFINYYQFREVLDCEYKIECNSGTPIDFLTYLNENPLHIFLFDFGSVINNEFFPPQPEDSFQFDSQNIDAVDWTSSNTDITKELYISNEEKLRNENKNSVQESIRDKLISEGYPIVIFDHGTWEICDFISFRENQDSIDICLYHVKGSTGTSPGDRVGDVYEVCMQAVKSQIWVKPKKVFIEKVISRVSGNPEKFIVGNQTSFETIMGKNKRINFSFAIIQPGISQSTLTPKLSYILAAADDSIRNNGFERLLVFGS